MREQWGSRWGFIFAVAGSAVGLGNIWKFPYVCGMNGGGAFVLLYLVCVVLVGFPLLLAELAIGRATQTSAVGAFLAKNKARTVFSDLIGSLLIIIGVILLFLKQYGYGTAVTASGIAFLAFGWKTAGFISGVIIPIIITGYYGVIGGWTLLYMGKAFLRQLNFGDPAGAAAVMEPIAAASGNMMFPVLGCTVLFMVLCAAVCFSGVRKGIERWSKVLMPLLFCLLVVLIVRGLTLPGADKGLKFFLSPDFSKLSTNSVIAAMGHSFFSLSLGMGIVLTYGSYLGKKENIINSAISVLVLDTMAAMMAGLAIFPAVFAMGFKETSGPRLIYEVLPASFNHIPGGWLWNGMFFMMIAIAAFTSEMSLFEPPVRVFVDEFKMKRRNAVILTASICIVLGVICVFSMSDWSRYPAIHNFLLKVWGEDLSPSLFLVLDSFACNWLLPLCGFILSLYVGWVWGSHRAVKELRKGTDGSIDGNLWLQIAGFKDTASSDEGRISLFSLAVLWGFFVRFITPVVVFIAFLNAVGAVKF